MTRSDDLRRFLEEDLADAGDITSLATLPADLPAEAIILARGDIVVAGVEEAVAVFERLGVSCDVLSADGARVSAGARILAVEGAARAILAGERLALNLLMRMSGIATLTSEIQRRVAAVNPACRVAATRKTTPGFRAYEKRAVALGGGEPHRSGLHDAFLVKDNHRAFLGVAEAVRRCRAYDPAKTVEVEVESLEDAVAAAAAGADWILIDNQTPEVAEAWAKAARAAKPDLKVEVSGGLTPENAHLAARAADRVSLGWLTHSPRAADLTLEMRPFAR
ncbi:MAG TPA: carboxylating nicotinate-nucleotide diphosphorylase [Candidatus Thermoplasmatota archaeon]|nr:carboxylating nicotinate-nucleotide diphosphorylase [Candidatus Thermoplasmatota archaeon]